MTRFVLLLGILLAWLLPTPAKTNAGNREKSTCPGGYLSRCYQFSK